MSLIEVQIDRIVGPTHHFGGLGVGNVASMKNDGSISNPKAAALQGLDKMRLVAELGVPQFVLPPQPRPANELLRALGFGLEGEIDYEEAMTSAPRVLSAAMSCSAMWTANAATASASVDGSLKKAAITIANLNSSLHRAIEPADTLADLKAILPDGVQVHHPLAGGTAMRDEGAANHMRFGSNKEQPGIHVFVYGDGDPLPTKHFPRQTLASCQAIARLHKLPDENTFYLKQHPSAIDAGAFHNDVVAASHHGLFLHHELAYLNGEQTLSRIAARYKDLYDTDLIRIEVASSELNINDAIQTYLFNSQIISVPKLGRPVILCPAQVDESARAKRIVDRWIADGHFDSARFLDLRQSMSGGGGPACLRLRVPLDADDLDRMSKNAEWTPKLDQRLRSAIDDHYPDAITLQKLCEIKIMDQTQRATNAIRAALES